MKLLHVSDLHIGKRLGGLSLADDQRFVLSQIVSVASSNRVSAVIVAGDIYDKASPSAEAVLMFDAFLTELAGAGIQVLAVPGNHDSAERIAYAQGLLARQGVCFAPVFDGELRRVVLEDEHGPAAFWLLPFLKPADVRRFFPEADIGDDYSAALSAVLGACDVDTGMRNVVIAHQLVTAGGSAPDRADDEIKLGGIDNVDVSVFDAFDYVALGHVHRPQRIGRDTARYSGSPLKYSFSEARYAKSATLVTLGAKGPQDMPGDCVSFELLPLATLHDMREIRGTLAEVLGAARGVACGPEIANGAEAAASMREADDATQVEAASGDTAPETDAERDPALDYLHVTLTDEHPQLDAMSRIREVFPNALALDYESPALLERRERATATVDPDKTDTVELFSRFYTEQLGSPLDEVQRGIVEAVVREVEQGHSRGELGREGGAL